MLDKYIVEVETDVHYNITKTLVTWFISVTERVGHIQDVSRNVQHCLKIGKLCYLLAVITVAFSVVAGISIGSKTSFQITIGEVTLINFLIGGVGQLGQIRE